MLVNCVPRAMEVGGREVLTSFGGEGAGALGRWMFFLVRACRGARKGCQTHILV